MVGLVGLRNPKMRMVLDQRIARVQKLKHSKQSVLVSLFDLVRAHDIRVFGTHLPKEPEFYDSNLSAGGELIRQQVLEEMGEVFDQSKKMRHHLALEVTQRKNPP
jgi:hypothetical protein